MPEIQLVVEERTRLSVLAQGHEGSSPCLHQQNLMQDTLLQNEGGRSAVAQLFLFTVINSVSVQLVILLIKACFQGWSADH